MSQRLTDPAAASGIFSLHIGESSRQISSRHLLDRPLLFQTEAFETIVKCG